jgi:carbamoyltransferase
MNGEKMYSDKFSELFHVNSRKAEDPLTQEYMDIAKSIQEVTEIIMLKLAAYAHKITGKDFLVMAGGVALNCVANGKLLKQSPFKDIWIQPASGDAGGAIGAALDYYYEKISTHRENIISVNNQPSSLYGPSYSNTEIKAYLDWHNYPYHFLQPANKYQTIAKEVEAAKVIGFFTNRMEYGPRALGARSIIADARSSEMQSKLNLKIKYRESFRPFAPVVLEEDVQQYFEIDRPSPYMLIVEEVKKKDQKPIPEDILKENDFIRKLNFPRSTIPAVTHLDYSARIQTVNETQNPELYRVIKAFKELTGSSVLVNTSFNVRGEPIVCTPEDAYLCFMRTEMDTLILEDFILYKNEQPALSNDENWKDKYELD